MLDIKISNLGEGLSELSGSYSIATDLKNGRNRWKKSDNLLILWFDKDKDHWSISSTGSKEGKIIAPSKYHCPSRIGSNWQYYDDSKDLKNAGDEIKVTCSGALVDDI